MKTTIFKLWLHAEEITRNEEGEEIGHKNLDKEFLPVLASICLKKSDIPTDMLSASYHDAAVELLEQILKNVQVVSPYDKWIYILLDKINRLPPDFKPYWVV